MRAAGQGEGQWENLTGDELKIVIEMIKYRGGI